MRFNYTFILMVFCVNSFAQITPPAGIGSSENLIMWLSPDTAVFNSSGNPASEGEDVHEWHDISGNGFIFRNTRNSRRPEFTTVNNKNYLDFTSGDFLFNSAIRDSINGLEEFSIFAVIKSDVTNTDKGLLYWKYPPDGHDDGLCLRYDRSGWWTGRSNVIKSGFQGNSGQNQIETTNNTQTTNRQVLTLTWKKGEKIHCFIDGVENDSSDLSLDNALSGIQEILIGKGAKDGNNNAGWNGKIGTFIFYNQEFNSDTVKDISNDLDLIFSVQSGNWNDPNSWDCSCVPTSSQKVRIDGHNITLTQDEEINNLTLWQNSGLDIGTHTLSIYGDLASHSEITAQNGKISFVGNSPQSIITTYKTNYGDIDIDNSSGVTLKFGPIFVLGTLNLISGTLTTDSKLVIASNDTITGRIASIPSGAAINGNVTVQRYIYNDNRIYRYLSSPVSNAMVSDWQNEIPITGPFENPDSGPELNSANPSLYYYDETQSGGLSTGWVSYPSSGNSADAPLIPGVGYGIFVRDNTDRPEYVDVTGTINSGDITLNLDYSELTTLTEDGWNLIGNPYPSQIDWQAIPLTRRIGIDNAIYYTDNTTGTAVFRSFVNGISVPFGGNGVIGSSQAFWVHANALSPTIEFNESDKVGSTYSFYKAKQPSEILRIGLTEISSNQYDETVIYLNELSTDTFDMEYDAYKFGSNGVSISSNVNSGKNMGINALPLDPQTEKILPIVLDEIDNDQYRLSITGVNTFDQGINIELIDSVLETNTLITEDTEFVYDLTTSPSSYENRFSLKLTNTNEVVINDIDDNILSDLTIYPNPVDGDLLFIHYNTSTSENIRLELKNSYGTILKKLSNSDFLHSGTSFSTEISVGNYPSGIYFVSVYDKSETKVVKVIIN